MSQCLDPKTQLSHIPTHMVTNIGRPPTQLVPGTDIFAWCFSEILGFHLLAIFCIYLYGERVWTRQRRIGIMKRRKGQKAPNSDQSSFEQSKRLVQSKLKRQSLEEGTLQPDIDFVGQEAVIRVHQSALIALPIIDGPLTRGATTHMCVLHSFSTALFNFVQLSYRFFDVHMST